MKFYLLLIAVLFYIDTTTAQANGIDISNFPKQWSGEAGDLVTRVPASLTIQKMELIQNHGKDNSEEQEYSIEGAFKFGTRVVRISRATLVSYSSSESDFGAEMNFSLEDNLTPNLFVAIVLNRQNKEYLLKDLISPPGGHRLLLRAPAK